MKVVVFLAKEDFTERQLKLIGPATFYNEVVKSEADLIEKCRDAEAVLATPKRVIQLTANFFNSLPKLKFVSVYATGCDWVDVSAAKVHGVEISYCPGYCTSAVAEWTITMLQKLCQPKGKTLGVIGLGRIGQAVAEKANKLGMKVIAWDRQQKSRVQVPLVKLLKESDVVSLHLELNDGTRGFIGKKEFEMIKQGAFLINPSREGLVNGEALKNALESGKLAGAAIDLDPGSKTILKNTLTTPHMAWKNPESFLIGDKMFVQNLVKWRNGKPQNLLA
ncbi:MAG: NAD(P)-dependent oxidoreductase [Candidatus Micrarchaeota archaeon]